MALGLLFRFILSFFILFSPLSAVPTSYLLPSTHPITPILDALFSQSRATLSLKSLENAGFIFSPPRKFTNLIIARHPSLPGYLFKLYLDAQRYHKNKPEHHFWCLRIEGARHIQQVIDTYNLHDFFKVPKKWIYLLPSHPQPPSGYLPKDSILVEEDMFLLPPQENKNLWKSSFVTPQHLFGLFLILNTVGLSDCTKIDNIPFSIDGRIAFIDTQSHHQTVHFKNLSSSLSDDNASLWQTFTSTH